MNKSDQCRLHEWKVINYLFNNNPGVIMSETGDSLAPTAKAEVGIYKRGRLKVNTYHVLLISDCNTENNCS